MANLKDKNKNNNKKPEDKNPRGGLVQSILLPRNVVLQIAEEVANQIKRRRPEKKESKPKIENPLFVDTSAIIDGRMFDMVGLGVFQGNFVILESVLSELKNIADSKDDIKKERGRKALRYLDEVKKQKGVKLIILKDEEGKIPVDDAIVQQAKKNKGRVITCDFNLSKKARISGVVSINIHEVANVLKTQAIPGEVYYLKVIQKGKVEGQGVGYLPDGTMIVVEKGEELIGKTVKIVVSRIIQTDAGKILFSKIVQE